MPTIAENQINHPEWFVIDPDRLPAEVVQFLTWQAAQPNPVGPGTIGDAWEQGGTGAYYLAHVATAKATIGRYESTGEAKPWLSESHIAEDRAKPEGAVFGGS